MNVSAPKDTLAPYVGAGALSRGELTRTIEAAVDLAIDTVSRPRTASVAVRTSLQDDVGFAGGLAAISSPEALFYLAQLELKKSEQHEAVNRAHTNSAKAQSEVKHRIHLLDEAIKAAGKKAKRPRFLRKLIKAIVSVVAAAATAMSGGALGGLAIAGMVLMFASEHIVKGLDKLGVLPPKVAGWLALALKIAGSILVSVAGPHGVKSAAESVAKLTKSATDVANYAQIAVAAAESVVDTHSVVWAKREKSARLDIKASTLRRDESLAVMKEAVEAAVDDFRRFSRVSKRVMKLADIKSEARIAATQLLA